MSKQCSICSHQNNDNARFCSQCGQTFPTGPLVGMLQQMTVLNGRYQITSKLGQGGQGSVYLADDLLFAGNKWAIKEISPANIADPVERQEVVTAFRREAEILAALQHRNLPRVIDRFTLQGNEFFVMEFVPGNSLQAIFDARGASFSEAEVRGYALQLCDVLHYLHSQRPPIIFRDLKPDNIMLAPDQTIKLIDFGVARHFRAGISKDTIALGTVGFAPPEAFGKAQTDARSDVFSLGATLFVLLTGFDPAQKPFSFPPLRTLNGAASLGMEKVLQKATHFQAEDRFQTMKEFETALVTEEAVVVTPPRPSAPPPLKQAPTATRPDAPSNVTAKLGNGGITVSWRPPSPTNFSNRAILSYRVTAGPGGYTYEAKPNVNELYINNLQSGRDYSFSVKAVNVIGESIPSVSTDLLHFPAASKTASPAAASGDIKRAGFWTFLFAVGLAVGVGVGMSAASLFSFLPFDVVNGCTYAVVPLLIYLLTHRAGAMTAGYGALIFLLSIYTLPFGTDILSVLVALPAEILFVKSQWRTRDLPLMMVAGAVVALTTLIVTSIIYGTLNFDFSSLFFCAIGGAFGGVLALIISTLVNQLTRVGMTS